MVNADGWCQAHGPGASERMLERALKGGAATAAKHRRTFDADKLPALDSIESAQTWLEAIGRAVAGGDLSDRQANSCTKVIEVWIRSKGALDSEQGDELRRVLSELRKRAG